MQGTIEEYEEDASPLTDGEYEEGLDDDDDYDEEEYDEEADLIGDEDLEEEEHGRQNGYIRGLEPLPPAGPRPAGLGQGIPNQRPATEPKPWNGLQSLPAATAQTYLQLLNKLRGLNKKQITILLLGKHFVGKSCTLNAILNEEAAARQFLNRETGAPVSHARESNEFTFTVIDSSGLTELDTVSTTILEQITRHIKGKQIDVVLYVDRFDLYRTNGTDHQVIQAISNFFGPSIWNNALVGLTHAGQTMNGTPWAEFAAKRSEAMQQEIWKYGQNKTAGLPVVFIENSPTCPKNDQGQKQLPDLRAWLPDLMEKVTDVAASTPAYTYNPVAVEKATNPNKKYRWLIPLLVAAQIALKVFVFDRLIEDDSVTGDKHGPYDPSIVRAERARIRMEEEDRAEEEARRRRRTFAAPARRPRVQDYDSDSD